MILGFKKQFVQKIIDGEKIHTIREDKTRRWRYGMDIHFATGVRTKQYNQFYRSRCKKVDEIEILWNRFVKVDFNSPSPSCIMIDKENYFSVRVNGCELNYDEVCSLAKNDGFENVGEFAKWFSSDFKGRIIYWF